MGYLYKAFTVKTHTFHQTGFQSLHFTVLHGNVFGGYSINFEKPKELKSGQECPAVSKDMKEGVEISEKGWCIGSTVH